MTTEDPGFVKEVYRELGDRVRNINTMRNTYRTISGVGIVAVLGLLAQRDGLNWVAWLIVAAIAGIGSVFTWFTDGYIQRPLHRQRQIEVALLSPWWQNYLAIAPERSNSFWTRRLDWFDRLFYLLLAVAFTLLAIIESVWGLS